MKKLASKIIYPNSPQISGYYLDLLNVLTEDHVYLYAVNANFLNQIKASILMDINEKVTF